MTPTEFCAKARTGVNDPTAEDQYALRSVATRTADGRIVDADAKTVGSIHACFGRTATPGLSQFYGDVVLGETVFKGLGECQLTKADFPERGLNVFRCFLELSGLPGDYVGGQLTANTMNSRKFTGTESDPAGYVQPSIATIRLWKKREAR
jgi:hypothetical protein